MTTLRAGASGAVEPVEAPDTQRTAAAQVELAALRAERSVLLADRERLALRLASVQSEHDRTAAELEALAASVNADAGRPSSDQAAELAVELAATRRDRDLVHEELRRTRQERDQVRIDLLRWELLARTAEEPATDRGSAGGDGDAGQLAELRGQLAAIAGSAAALQQELTAHRRTVSWRVTAPLRVVRRWQLRR